MTSTFGLVLDTSAARTGGVSGPVSPPAAAGTAWAGAHRLAFQGAARSIVGPRTDNQDAALASASLIAVADGVGGKVGGAVASSLVIDSLARTAEAWPSADQPDALRRAAAVANGCLQVAKTRRPGLTGMATTLTAAALGTNGCIHVMHVGDTRLYLCRAGELVQLTRDHTLVQSLKDAGTITDAQVRSHPLRSTLLAALHGRADDLSGVQSITVPVQLGDRLLVCSDGLSGVVEPELINRILGDEGEPDRVVSRLLRAALAASTRDNVTAVLVDVVVAADGVSHPVMRVGSPETTGCETFRRCSGGAGQRE
ncbi:protein phosphatase 2C domain-containing protein [Blastococcus sp. CT_GayMR16]|uniref:PP2C family protein-serine/threonine phosphatase n=1 Tax=Blastococcus sp. CT_GayMR16 TaxID=2559607 RepID=UPI00142FDEDC|nr:protein phosphatase 2C domain-containing protein [Blastococcus sp. CT_GayMR16]